MSVNPVPYQQDVSVITRQFVGRDSDGNKVYQDVPVVIRGAVTYPRGGTELVQGRDQVIQGLMLLAPPETTLVANDNVMVDGEMYYVDGPPERYQNPLDGSRALQAPLTRITG